jgi:UTP--glucose-1-phosphate uridylyltransferase
MLGDAIFSRIDDSKLPAQQLRETFEQYGTAVIGLEEVPEEKVERYGIVGGDVIAPGVLKLNALVEKPPRDKAPSRYAIAARYLLTPAIFECLDQTKPGKGGEIQLTDALQLLLQREPIHGVVLKSRRHDIGDPIDWLKTNLVFARQNESTWRAIEPLLRELLAR